MPIFPTTPILDNFNRPDEGGPPSSSWRDIWGCVVESHELVSAVGNTDNFSIYDTIYGPDCEVYFRISELSIYDVTLKLYIRYLPSDNTGYYLLLDFQAAGPDTLQIYRQDPGGGAAIGILVGALALAADDSIGIRIIGNTVTSYYKIGAGAWTLQDTVVDATYGTSGYTGVVLKYNWAVDSYGVGTIVGGAFPQSGVVDTFLRGDEPIPPSLGWKDIPSTRVVSNQCGEVALGYESFTLWNNPSVGPDCEVYAEIGALPPDGKGLYLYARLDSNFTVPAGGYSLFWIYNLAGADTIALFNISTGLLASQAQDLAPGDRMGMQLIGDTIYVYVDVGAGWTLLYSTVDPAPYIAAGYLGIYFEEYVARLDNFGGGAYSSPGAGATGTTSGSGNLAHSVDTNVYVQFGDGKECYYLGDCTVIPSLPNPTTDQRPMFSSIGAREYNQIGFEPGAPGSTTLTITTFVAAAANYLEQIKESGCSFNLYVLTACEGTELSINNYDRAWVYRNCGITDDSIENARAIEDDKLLEHVFNVTAWNGRVDHRPIAINRIETSEVGDAFCVALFPSRCASDCEEAVAACQQVVIGAGSVGGAVPDIYYTLDGDTWASPASQFQATSDITGIATFQDLNGDYAWLGIRNGLAVLPLRCEVGVIGASAIVNIGAVAVEGVLKDSAVFVLDARHIWVCTDTGRVYFSGDGAQTWAEQASALVASGGDVLRAIHFADALVGYCVGNNDTILHTTNGGETWADNPSGLGEAWLSLWVFDRQRLIIGNYSIVGSGGNLFMSYDAATTWNDISRWPVTAAVSVGWDVRFLPDNLTGYLLVDIIGGNAGTIYKSINGGYDWRPITTPSNVWCQSIAICKPNQGYAVGSVSSGTTFIAEISG